MKKITAIILALVLVLALAACGNSGNDNSSATPAPAENNTPAHALMTAETIFHAAGAGALRDVILTAAPRNEASPLYEV